MKEWGDGLYPVYRGQSFLLYGILNLVLSEFWFSKTDPPKVQISKHQLKTDGIPWVHQIVTLTKTWIPWANSARTPSLVPFGEESFHCYSPSFLSAAPDQFVKPVSGTCLYWIVFKWANESQWLLAVESQEKHRRETKYNKRNEGASCLQE